MKLDILINRLQGVIAGFILEEGLLASVLMAAFPPNNINFIRIGVIALQVFLGGWLFFDRRVALKLAVICKTFLCGSALRYILLAHSHPSTSGVDKKLLFYWSIFILEGVQVMLLLWIVKLKIRLSNQ